MARASTAKIAKTSTPKVSAASTGDILESLLPQVKAIRFQLARQNSLTQAFIRGLMTGLGATVGVAVVVALSVFIIVQVARLLGFESAAQSIVETLQ